MITPLGVGILGAGPVTQAIHLPTLARLPDQFRVVAVMDIDASVAELAAAQAGAEPTQSMQAVLDHPGVDVVAVCSPHQFHAEQVAAICAAGKRGILCEKPLATTQAEAEEIRKVVTAAEIPLVVGAMHAYDPGWLAALDACAGWRGRAHTIRSTIVLPFNDRFEDSATEIASRPAPPPPTGILNAEERAERIRGLVLGLSIHDLPLVRAFAPAFEPGRSCRVRRAVRRRDLADGRGTAGRAHRVHAAGLAAGLAPGGMGRGSVTVGVVHPVLRARGLGQRDHPGPPRRAAHHRIAFQRI